jgi:hypothetical protein
MPSWDAQGRIYVLPTDERAVQIPKNLVAAVSYQNTFPILLPHETKKVKMHETHSSAFENRVPGAGVNSWAKQDMECMKE